MLIQRKSRFEYLLIILVAVLTFATNAVGDAFAQKKGKKAKIVELTEKAPVNWILKTAEIGASILSDRDYAFSALPAKVKGGTLLVRTTGGDESWLKPLALRARKPATVYAIVRWKFDGKEVMRELDRIKFQRDGWKEVKGDTRTTFPNGSDWQWKTYSKEIPKGLVILQLKTLTWRNNWAVVYVFK